LSVKNNSRFTIPQNTALLFYKSVVLMTFVMTAVAFAGSVFSINKEALPFKVFNINFSKAILVVFIIVGAAALVILWRYLFKLTARVSSRTLSILCVCMFLVFSAVCAVMCLFMKVTPATDVKNIQDMALYMAENNTYHIDTTNGYFQNYSNNDLLTILTSIFFRCFKKLGINNLSQACIWLNAVCIIIAEVLAFFGTKVLFGLKVACRYLILSVMQPTIYLTVVWPYSNTLCLPFMTGLFLLGALIYRSKQSFARFIYIALFALVAVLGYYIRPVVMFEAIAFAMFAVICLVFKKHIFKQALAYICIAVVFGASSFVCMSKIVDTYGGDNSRNFPVTHWLMLGLNENGRFNSKDSSFTRKHITKEEKIKANLDEINKSLKEIGVLGLPVHAVKKQIITWSEGSGNYYLRAKNIEETNFITNITVGSGRKYIMLYCQMYRAAVLFLAAFAMLCLLRRKSISRSFYALITLFGGMVFYLFWEAKESYSIPFLFIIVLFATMGVERLSELKMHKKTGENKIKTEEDETIQV